MTLREVAERVGGWVAPENYEKQILGLAALVDAGEGDITFFGSPKYLKALQRCRGTAVLVPHGFGEEVRAVRVWVDNPSEAFAILQEAFAPVPREFAAGIHPTAVVDPTVEIGEGVSVQPYAVIEEGAKIGARSVIGAHSYIGQFAIVGTDCRIFANVHIADRSRLGNRVFLNPGVVIGAEGFGYEFRDGRQVKIPQTGFVQIDDDVEIGANSTVDRARFGRTWIQEGTKVDNLVQIGHNVTVGKHCILCAHVGISGSTRVGNFVTLAGKVGVNGHIEIGDGAVVTAMAGVTKSVPSKEILVGLPAKPMREYKTNYVQLHNIGKLYERVKTLEEKAGA